MDWLPVEQLKKQNAEHFDKEMTQLIETCQKYPDIAEFVRVLVPGLLSKEGTEEYKVADALSTFLYDICGMDIYTALTNPCHYKGDWLYNLNFFIGNFFLDDAFFTVTQTAVWNMWKAADSECGCQKPLVLIAAAKENARFIRKMSPLKGKDLKKALKEGMKSSGEVEKALEERKAR